MDITLTHILNLMFLPVYVMIGGEDNCIRKKKKVVELMGKHF